jgi:hypothetical protein
MLTPDQIRNIHVAYRSLGWTDSQYRMALRNVAGVESCKALSNAQYEDVMAILEQSGFSQRKDGVEISSTYWRDKVASRGARATDREIHLIMQLHHQQLPHHGYELPGLVSHATKERTADVRQLTPGEAFDLIEMLKAICSRQSPPVPPTPLAPPAPSSVASPVVPTPSSADPIQTFENEGGSIPTADIPF